jgi:hypothetical protein
MWIGHNDETVGVVAPFRLQEQLSHISFKTEEGTVEHLDN